MIVSAHAAAGAALGSIMKTKSYKDWALLVAAGVASHAVLDFIPYWYSDHSVFIAVDTALIIVISLAIIYGTGRFYPVLVGTIAAVAPDLEHVLVEYSIILEETVYISHRAWFPRSIIPPFWGILIQAIFTIFFIWAAFRYKRPPEE